MIFFSFFLDIYVLFLSLFTNSTIVIGCTHFVKKIDIYHMMLLPRQSCYNICNNLGNDIFLLIVQFITTFVMI